MRAQLGFLFLLALPLIALIGCGHSGPVGGPGVGTVRLHLTDASADYDSVVVLVHEVSIHRGSDESGGWEVIKNDTTAYDLLTLRDGVFATLGTGDVPAGHYTQVRLVLLEGSYLVTGGVRYPLFVPSGVQSGYKLVGEFDVPAGGAVDVGLDFDAARSVVLNGAGEYHLKPTVRVLPMLLVGAIDGTLHPEVAASILALAGSDTVASTSPGKDGNFTLALLPPNVYSVAIDPDEAFRDTTIAAVPVAAGATTHLGTVTLTPQ